MSGDRFSGYEPAGLSPDRRMRMSSIIRSRSGVVLSFVVETSCLIIGKNHNRQPGAQTQCTAFSSSLYPHHARQCRASGLSN